MVEIKENMDERLDWIKKFIRKAQLQSNLIENPEIGREVDLAGISETVEKAFAQALTMAHEIPPLERMIDEVLKVWKGQMPFRKIADLEYFAGWLVGCTFSIISVIDFLLEVDA